MKKQIAVIFGGPSEEHEVSISSAKNTMAALDRVKYDILPIAINKQGKWLVGTSQQKYLSSKKADNQGISFSSFAKSDAKDKIDLVLPILHGPYGEDGKLQGMLETLGIPFVFSGTFASALAMNKTKTKALVQRAGVGVLPEVILSKDSTALPGDIMKDLSFPVVVKPVELGSSVGIVLVREANQLNNAIQEARQYDDEVMIEQFAGGRELTVTVMGNKNPKALPVIEIIPRLSEWYDYDSKYADGGSDHICPAKIPAEIEKRVKEAAIKAFKVVGCHDLARADFIWDAKGGKVYFLEINTIPGMTPTSLTPEAAKAAGMEFGEFLDELIEGAFSRN